MEHHPSLLRRLIRELLGQSCLRAESEPECGKGCSYLTMLLEEFALVVVVVGLNSEKESRWTLEETRGQARDMTELEILVAEAVAAAAAVADFDRVGVSRRGT